MSDQEASMAGGETARRRGAKPSNGAAKKGAKDAKPPAAETARLQLHLPPELVQRLGVHCSMLRTSWSTEAARILGQYLAAHGKGKELFKDNPALLEPLAE
jgi:hypothetical protein